MIPVKVIISFIFWPVSHYNRVLLIPLCLNSPAVIKLILTLESDPPDSLLLLYDKRYNKTVICSSLEKIHYINK